MSAGRAARLARALALVGLLTLLGADVGLAQGTRPAPRLAQRTRPAPRLAQRTRPAPAPLLAATPYLGWDSYLAYGSHFNEADILAQAHQLAARGLVKVGYRYVWFDVGWWHGTRDASGQITVEEAQWPHGLAWLTRTLHAAGLLVGLYTDAGIDGCGGAGQGSYGHYQQDIDTFAAWGFDAVKVDFCGAARLGLVPADAYAAVHRAIASNSRHRSMLLSICNFLEPGQLPDGSPGLARSSFASWSFGPRTGNSWRTDTDVGRPGHVFFSNVLRNLDADAAHPLAAGPGHWNDPDYLAPDQGLSDVQLRTQFCMWAMLAAPLMISDNLTAMRPASQVAVENPEVIAVDQDPAGVQGTLVASAGSGEVWVKPLSDGSRAVALLNRGSAPLAISASAVGIGMSAARGYRLRNLWSHTASTTRATITATVPSQATILLRVSALPPPVHRHGAAAHSRMPSARTRSRSAVPSRR